MRLIEILSVLLLSLSLSAQETPSLVAGQPVVREMTGGQSHAYRLALKKGQFVRLVADQRNVDLVLQVSNGAGQPVAEVDLTTYGSLEPLSFEAPADGEYRLTARGKHPAGLTGSYEMRLELRDAPTAADRKRLEAERLSNEARTLRGRPALERRLEAAARWREIGDEYWLARALLLAADGHRLVGQLAPAEQVADEALTLARGNRDRVSEAAALRTKGIALSMMGKFAPGTELFEQELTLRRALGDRVGEGSLYSSLGINQAQMGQHQKAIEFYDKAIAVFRELKDTDGERFPLHNSGDTYNMLGKYALASERFEQAIRAHRAANDPVAEAASLDSLGATYNYLGQPARAQEKSEAALAIRRRIQDRLGVANSLTGIAIALSAQGKYQQAIDRLDEALPITRELKARINEGRVLSLLGQTSFSLGQFDRAEEVVNQALAIRRELKTRGGEADSLVTLGNIHSILGRYELALQTYNQALDIYRTLKLRTFEASALGNLGIAYQYLGMPEKAIEFFEQAIALQRELKSENGVDYFLNNLGSAHRSLKNYARAIQYYAEAIELLRKNGDRHGESAATSNLVNCHINLGQYEKAREYAMEALRLSRESGNRPVEARTLTNLGNVLRRLGRLPEAAEQLRLGIALNREMGNRLNEAAAHFGLGMVEYERGQLNAARTELETAIGLIESLRGELLSPELRASFFTEAQEMYQSYIQLLQQLDQSNPGAGNAARAFEASERARARSLLELLNEIRADLRQGVDEKLLARERLLASQINVKAQSLQSARTAELIATTRQELTALETAHQLTQAEIRKTSPGFAALTQPQPLGLAEVQAQLDAETLLLQYSLGSKKSFLWAVSRTELRSYELAGREEIERHARRVYELLTERGRARRGESAAQRRAREARGDAELPAAARELSRLALGPLAGTLKSQRLVIVADGALQYIPFGALPAPGRAAEPMIVRHEIVSLPSASTLAVQRRETANRAPATDGIAVIANPVFSETDPRVKNLARKNEPAAAPAALDLAIASRSIEHLAEKETGAAGVRTLTIPALPFTRIEAEQILAAAPGPANFAALDFKANRAAALDAGLRRYRYLHFATHGYLDSERPGLSALLLSMLDESGAPQNGYLRANEIYNLRLAADLVVLSACQTGLGMEIRGEGLIGLTRGFMYAGAPRVVVSLWNVNDRATSDLMGRFYRKMLREKQRPAAALRAAQIEMWKSPQWRSPFYWAAFGLQGEWR
ncbi:MAG: tetratricopeptide repeat protein [Blastocatellia bacterium]|nr:tetratricopeptide repeat protein [Blastocatellia bacterium]